MTARPDVPDTPEPVEGITDDRGADTDAEAANQPQDGGA